MTLGFLAGMLVPELVIKVISLETGEIFKVLFLIVESIGRKPEK